MIECPTCGHENPGRAWRCDDCGKDLVDETPTRGEQEVDR